MKKSILLMGLLIAAMFASAQRVRLNLYSAYVFDDKFDSYYDDYNYYYGTVNGGYQWGAGIEYLLKPNYGLELVYYRQDTHAPTYYQEGALARTKYENFQFDANYIMIGGLRYLRSANEKVEGFAGLLIGMGIPYVKNETSGYSNTATKFAWGARLGANFWITPQIAIKLQAQLLSMVQGAGGGLYFGTGGAGVGLTTYSSLYQFGIGGGLTFRFGSK